MFEVNEAPNLVLSDISSHTTKRNCSTFLSVLCCLPTLGTSACGCWCYDPKCMFPETITLPTKAGLTALTDALNRVRYISSGKEEAKVDKRELITWQVKTTVDILDQSIKANHIQGDYKEVIEGSLRKIRIKAEQEEKFDKILSSKPTAPLITPTAPDAEPSSSYTKLTS
jgi:hypothetical protein